MTKLISPFDLASYSQLVNTSGSNPTTTDIRGTAAIGGVREWGALEYDASLVISSWAKIISPFDLASYSQLINTSGSSPTATDMRGTSAIDGVREWGALEYDSTLSVLPLQSVSVNPDNSAYRIKGVRIYP